MTDAPERIWAFEPDVFDNMSAWQDMPSPAGDTTAYIRADLHAAALAERDALKAALKLADAALRGCNMNMNHIRKKVDAALSEGEKP